MLYSCPSSLQCEGYHLCHDVMPSKAFQPGDEGCKIKCWLQAELGRGIMQTPMAFAEKEDGGSFKDEKMATHKSLFHDRVVSFAGKGVQECVDENVSEAIAYVASLRVCAKQRDLHRGGRLHAEILEKKLQSNLFVGTTLVYMYAKCGALAEAQQVFDALPARDVVPWNALISGYVQLGQAEKALNCYEEMQKEGISPNALTFSCALKACGSIRAAERGLLLHKQISREHVLERNIVVGNALIDMYAKCGLLEQARSVFDELPNRNVISWNTMITAYVEHGHGEEALLCFQEMQCQCLSPDAVTYVCALKACGSIKASEKGEEIHAQISQAGSLESCTVVGTALVDMYAKCGLLSKAQEAFDKLSVRDLAAWNALVAGYAQHPHGEQAISCFKQMQLQGFKPDGATFACVFKACGSISSLDKGQEVHAKTVREGMLERNRVVANALVDMYVKCGFLGKAQEVFNELSVYDVVSWNILVAGYAQHSHHEEALDCFEQMQNQGFLPDEVTLTCILKACQNIGAAHKGKEIHDVIVKEGLLVDFMFAANFQNLGNALIELYTGCGMVAEAQKVFDELPARDVVSWNILLTGHAQLGKGDLTFELFGKMMEGVLEPNMATFTILLNTCSHGGQLDRAQVSFQNISTRYGLTPHVQHYTCMIDLFGRAGQLDVAMALTQEMPFCADFTLLQSLLAAYLHTIDYDTYERIQQTIL